MNKPVLFSFQTEMPIPLIKKLLFPLQFVILYIKFPHIFGPPAKLSVSMPGPSYFNDYGVIFPNPSWKPIPKAKEPHCHLVTPMTLLL